MMNLSAADKKDLPEKMISLLLKLKDGTSLCFTDGVDGGRYDFSCLQKLVGGTLSQESGSAADVVIYPAETKEACSRFEEEHGFYSYFVPLPDTNRMKVLLWRKALLLAFSARILRGEKIMPVHGCLLKNKNGEGLLLCGQSGMGKSTTANRWKAAGCEFAADDMILLEYGGDTLYARPLPTWSRCAESVKGEEVPFQETIPVKTVLALSRDEETEAVREVEGFKYMCAVYSACSLFNLTLVKNAAPEQQKRLAAAIKGCADFLYERFPHRTFFANLQGNIKQTLEKEFT